MITVFWINYSKLKIESETIEKNNSQQLFDKMDNEHPDGWWETFDEAEEELNNLIHADDDNEFYDDDYDDFSPDLDFI